MLRSINGRLLLIALPMLILIACSATKVNTSTPFAQDNGFIHLEAKIDSIVKQTPGTVGVALVSDKDTICINNDIRFAMMSVVKLHQALAVCDMLDKQGLTLNSTVTLRRDSLNENTWSPMLDIFTEPEFTITVGDLIDYAIISSDNNASNLLFELWMSPAATERYIKSICEDDSFAIRYSEEEMQQNHDLSYENYTSPLAGALLIRRVFTDPFLSPDKQAHVKEALCNVTTGRDRLAKAILHRDDILFGHKTGSGYRNENGELIAHNDVGFFRLPDGQEYALAVFIRDFKGNEDAASRIIAEISTEVYDIMSHKPYKFRVYYQSSCPIEITVSNLYPGTALLNILLGGS